jgi:hypothetical protein
MITYDTILPRIPHVLKARIGLSHEFWETSADSSVPKTNEII